MVDKLDINYMRWKTFNWKAGVKIQCKYNVLPTTLNDSFDMSVIIDQVLEK